MLRCTKKKIVMLEKVGRKKRKMTTAMNTTLKNLEDHVRQIVKWSLRMVKYERGGKVI